MHNDRKRAHAVRTAVRRAPNRVAILRPTVYCPPARADTCVKEYALTGGSVMEYALTGASAERPR